MNYKCLLNYPELLLKRLLTVADEKHALQGKVDYWRKEARKSQLEIKSLLQRAKYFTFIQRIKFLYNGHL